MTLNSRMKANTTTRAMATELMNMNSLPYGPILDLRHKGRHGNRTASDRFSQPQERKGRPPQRPPQPWRVRPGLFGDVDRTAVQFAEVLIRHDDVVAVAEGRLHVVVAVLQIVVDRHFD